MVRIFFITILCLFIKATSAQHLTYTMYEILHKEDMKSSPVALQNQYDGILGNGFLGDNWMPGRAITSMKVYNNLQLRFDSYANKIYLNLNDTVYDITKSGIIQFDLFPNAPDTSKVLSFNNGFNVGAVTPDKFVNVLAYGKITFIRYYFKDIEEVFESSPTYKEKKFIDKNKYYIIVNSEEGKEVGVNKKNLEKILADKWDKVSSYAKEKNIATGNEDGWAKLIDYYNTLP